MELEGKVALITGSGRGIGEALAVGLAEVGATTVIADIDLNSAEQTSTRIKNRGSTALPVRVDVSDASSVKKMTETIINRFGKVDILVNNAAVVSHYALLELPKKEWDRVIGTNLTGTFLCVQSVVPSMIDNGGGTIVNISSIAADLPTPDYVHYGVSKAAILQLTKSLAVALAPHNIRVNAIQPGTIKTPMNADDLSKPNIVKEKLRQIALDHIGSPEELVGPVLFLVSPASKYVTGASLYVDGGAILLR